MLRSHSIRITGQKGLESRLKSLAEGNNHKPFGFSLSARVAAEFGFEPHRKIGSHGNKRSFECLAETI